jgi:hypothetical protein
MVTDYDSLRAAITTWTPRSDLLANVATAIQFTETQINRSLRNRQQEHRETATVSEYLPFPTDYLEVRDIQINTSRGKKTLDMMSPSQINAIDLSFGGGTGEPRAYCLIANQIQFSPAPDGTYTCEIVCFIKVPALSGSATTNWFLTDHPDVYLAGAQANLLQIANDPAAAAYMTLFRNLLEDVNRMDRRQTVVRFTDGNPARLGLFLSSVVMTHWSKHGLSQLHRP